MSFFREADSPWLDRSDAHIERYVAKNVPPGEAASATDDLRQWRNDGYVIFRRAIDGALIDAYLRDIEQLRATSTESDVLVNCETRGVVPIRQLTREEVDQPTLRILDFHNASTAGKKLILCKEVLSFLERVFEDQVVAMQTLTFLRGSQQPEHQDLPFVVAEKPMYLAASWIALEDVHPDAGPLAYYPGSHRIPQFDFGDGPFLTPDSPRREADFRDHLVAECTRRGIQPVSFEARKGDVFIWHALLAHAGTPVINPALTRRSLVAHYSAAHAYQRERRDPSWTPVRHYWNGGFCYGDPKRPQLENTFLAGGLMENDAFLDAPLKREP